MLRLDRITYRVGPRTLFDGASATVGPGHRVGFVGRNGAGKTTLLAMVTGDAEPDSGAIFVPSRWRIGVTRQEAPDGPENLVEVVLAADRELAQLEREAETATDPHRIADIHARLHAKGASRAAARAARLLAGLVEAEPDLLLLDEPTNHLDLEASLWLENHLRQYPGTVLLVSHDRDFLDRAVVSTIASEGQGRWIEYAGGYSDMLSQRGADLRKSVPAKARAERAAGGPSAAKATAKPRLSFKEKHALETLPGRIEALEREIERLQAVLGDAGLYARDPQAFSETAAALSRARDERASAEDEWLALALKREDVEGS